MWLIILAIVLQTGDATISCNKLSHPEYKEWNPFLGETCNSIIVRKILIATPLLIWNNKYAKLGLIASGGLGISFTLALDK